ncbi:MAG: NAD(P)-dependent oxidoreductase [Pseudomonadales bacterium]|nr:NAD(P)-dependent oxidoreductase [Pseudomonadales bacterium]
MRIAVTGATGVVGRFVIDRFASAGHELRALVRPTSALEGFAVVPQAVRGALADADALSVLLEGCDALVHCAFSHVPGRYRGGEGDDPEGFWRTNLLGTVRLLEAARGAGVGRAVLLSSRAVFARRRPGEDPQTPVDDDHPTWPDTHYGALKVAEEALAAAVTASGGPATTALRPTGVYGLVHPVSASKWYDLAREVVAGRPVTQVRAGTEVHGDDVAAAVECLLTAPDDAVAGRAFNCSDLLLDTHGLVTRIARLAGVPAEPPPSAPPPRTPMACPGLRALGWRPGGEARLEETLAALVDAVLSA